MRLYKKYLYYANFKVPRSTKHRILRDERRRRRHEQDSNLHIEQDFQQTFEHVAAEYMASSSPPSSSRPTHSGGVEDNSFDTTDYLQESIFSNFKLPEKASVLEEKLFSSSSLTIGECVLFVLSFFIKHKLTKEALKGLLSLLSELLPKPNKFPKTVYHLTKLVCSVTRNYKVTKHYYCKKCTYYLENLSANCPVCNFAIDSPGIFIEYPLDSLLKSLFEDQNLYKVFDTSGDDIPISLNQGQRYYKQKKEVLSNKYDISLMWNLDGVPIFKSRNVQLWPIQITIMELPPVLRQRFVAVCGLWIGELKPNMNTYLRPMCASLVKLFQEGFLWTHPITNSEVTSKVLAPLAVLDAPARALVLNMNQFNGESGCPYCEDIGDVVDVGAGHARVYLPNENSFLRTDNNIRSQALEASHMQKPVKGIKGITMVSSIPHLNLAESFSPDYMHGVLLGVTRQFLFLWLDSSNHLEQWYIGTKTPLLDQKLLQVKPPKFIQRLPRSLKSRKQWKASELRSWLLYYSIPILQNILPDKYLQHWILLVVSINILLQEQVDSCNIELSRSLLKVFHLDIQNLYSDQCYTFNVHQLLHLSSFVKNWGPLWNSSAFSFENNNGVLLKMVHGSMNPDAQLVNTLNLMNGMNVLEKYFISRTEENSETCLTTTHVQVLGVPLESSKVPHTCNTIVHHYINEECYNVFGRLKVNNIVFTSTVYKRQVKYDNSYVLINHPVFEFGKIECFLKNNTGSILCIMKGLDKDKNNIFYNNETGCKVQHIIPVIETDNVVVIRPNFIIDKVIVVKNFVIKRPNSFEENL